jgi:hypothetical protein
MKGFPPAACALPISPNHPNIFLMRAILFLLLTTSVGCSNFGTTARLPADWDQRLQREGVLRSANDLTFRYTLAPGRSRSHWEDRRASIVVTPATILIHKNAKIGLEVTPRTLRPVAIERDGSRVRIRAGSGRAEELWSFQPPDGDVVGWTRDLRAVISRNSKPASGGR